MPVDHEAEAAGLVGYRISIRPYDGRRDCGDVVLVERLRGGQ
jgi:hypothetical protein